MSLQAVRERRQSEALLAELLDALPDTTRLDFVDYDESLSAEDVEQAFTDYDTVLMRIEEDRWENRVHGEDYVLRDLPKAADGTSFQDLLTEHRDRLGDEIRERDHSNAFRDLLRNTGGMFLRYELTSGPEGLYHQDLKYGTGYPAAPEEFDVDQHAKRLCAVTGVDWDVNAGRFRQMVIEQAYYGGRLVVFWHGSPSDMLDHVNESLTGQPQPRTIRFVNPYVMLLDGVNGSGYGDFVEGTITRQCDPERIHTDKAGPGYGWNEIAGLVARPFQTDVRLFLGWTLTKEAT